MVPRPAIFDTYSRFMGGVDLLDRLSELYKFSCRSRRWCIYIWWHTVTVVVPGETAVQAETPTPKVKISGFCWPSQVQERSKIVADHCSLQKQRQPLPRREKKHRGAPRCEEGWLGSFPNMGNPTEMQALHRPLYPCVLSEMQSASLPKQRTETVFTPTTI